MSKSKTYHDADGNECTLFKMVRHEPEWACSTIEQLTQELEASRAREEWQPTETAPKDGTKTILGAEGVSNDGYFQSELQQKVEEMRDDLEALQASVNKILDAGMREKHESNPEAKNND